MAPSHGKPDAPAHPPVPQRLAPGGPATRRDNLLHMYAFRLVRQVTSSSCRSLDPRKCGNKTSALVALLKPRRGRSIEFRRVYDGAPAN